MGLFSAGGLMKKVTAFFNGKRNAPRDQKKVAAQNEDHFTAVPVRPAPTETKRRRDGLVLGADGRLHELGSARARGLGVESPSGRWLTPFALRLKRLKPHPIGHGTALKRQRGQDVAKTLAHYGAAA